MEKTYTIRQEQLARFAKALAHPARIAIMQFLMAREECFFGAIDEFLPIQKSTVSQHLKELMDSGLIQGNVTQPRIKYCVNRDNALLASELFAGLFANCKFYEPKKGSCCCQDD